MSKIEPGPGTDRESIGMDERAEGDPSPRRGRAGPVAALAVLAVGLWPWMNHLLRHPSLLSDDAARVEDLQLRPLSALLLRPFNEHLAPLFETVSWLAWQGAGRQLAHAAAAFTVASYLPFVLALLALGNLARRLLGSRAAASLVVAVFALTPAHAEVVYWYSASSFAWALAATLMAMDAADRGRITGRWGWSALAAGFAFLAPCGSSIGLLAGPAAIAIGWPDRRGRRGLRPAIAVALGISAYLGMALLARQDAVIGRSVGHSTEFARALPWMLRAPAYLLATGPLARHGAEDRALTTAAAGVGAAVVGLMLLAARRGPRRLVAASAGLMAGGYLLTYPFRVGMFPEASILVAGRYHLFPMAGLALILGAVAAPILARLDRARRGSAPAAVLGLAVALAFANVAAIRERSLWQRFPEQPATLRGLDRLAEVCRDRGITRDQAIRRLDPILARWNNPDFNCLRLLPRISAEPRVADDRVFTTILAALTPEERADLFGGMDVSARLVPSAAWPGITAGTTPAALVGRFRVEAAGAAGHYRHDGSPSYLEYQLDGPAPAALRLPALDTTEAVQLWWADAASGAWSPGRSVTLMPKMGGHHLADVVLPLSAIPQIRPGEGRRIRLAFCEKGEIALAPPEAVRGVVR